MPRSRVAYPPEFRQKMLELVRSAGFSPFRQLKRRQVAKVLAD